MSDTPEFQVGDKVQDRAGLIFVVLGLGASETGQPIALIAGVYHAVSEQHATIPNRVERVDDLVLFAKARYAPADATTIAIADDRGALDRAQLREEIAKAIRDTTFDADEDDLAETCLKEADNILALPRVATLLSMAALTPTIAEVLDCFNADGHTPTEEQSDETGVRAYIFSESDILAVRRALAVFGPRRIPVRRPGAEAAR